MKRRQKLWWVACAGALVAGFAAVGGFRWQQHRLERRIGDTIAAIEAGEDPGIREQFLADLVRHPEYRLELQLFRAASLLRAGFPEAVGSSLGDLPPNDRCRQARWMLIGEASHKTGQLGEAELAFRHVLSLNPKHHRAHRMLAATYHSLGNIRAAYAELEEVTRQDPDDWYAYRLMGQLNLLDFHENKEAAECYRMALARNPPDSQRQAIRMELAQALQNLNDYTGAIETLDGADADAKVLALRAGARWGLGQKEETEQLLRQAVALDPAEPAALLLKAKISLEDGKPGEALEPLQRLLDRDPHNFSVRYQLSRAYQRLGETDAAAAELERMNASKLMLRKLGELYIQTMERTRDPAVREELAELCDRLDRHELAQLWRRSAEFCRRNGEVPEQ